MATSSSTKRFAEIPSEDEIKRLRYSKGTLYQTQNAKNLFLKFLMEHDLMLVPSDSQFKVTLDLFVHKFLLSIRKDDGEYYSVSGFDGLFYSLSRFIMEEYAFDLIHDVLFTKTRNARKSMKTILKSVGKGYIKHTDTISSVDLDKISNMDTTTPELLQLKTWFILHFHLALRGCENSHTMTKDNLVFGMTESGDRY
jgi:hypothetical protein